MKPKQPKFKLFQTFVILLSLLLMIQGCIFFHRFLEEIAPNKYSTNDMLNMLQRDESYTSLHFYLSSRTAQEIAEDENLSELYAVCLYYENSMYYHAYTNIGDTETALLYLAACQDAAKNAGELSICTQEIDAFFQ